MTHVIVMGVSGAGKTTLARALAASWGWPFQEGDDLHPQANVAKMRAAIPLDDADRAPWLAAIRAWIETNRAASTSGVVSCSAQRAGHYMPASLLDSQLAALDPPSASEALIIDAALPIAEQVERSLAALGDRPQLLP